MAASNPIQIVPLHGDALAAPVSAAHLTYRGGPLLQAAQVFVFFWGTAWEGPQAALVQQINQFFDFILTSPLLDQLAEYSVAGTSIGHGSRTGSVILSTDPPASIADSDITSLIQQEITNDSAVPQPTANTLYHVFLPPGVTITLDGGMSCSNFCGYHSDINGRIFYAVVPYPDCSECTGPVSVMDALTSTTSHELCEAITDPVPGQGWYDDRNGEIGDICAWKTRRLGSFSVQLEWSNKAGQCI
ncbi:MAG TPA: hypothetical protein VN965_08670 [Candidatus Dormibacteraeota bacterium]|nr:hypothetical protein [Candidatus Dormibacteraeota bacterium]